MKITSALRGAALAGSIFAAGAAQAGQVVYQSVPDLAVAPGPAWCSQCGSDGQNIGQFFTLASDAYVDTLTFVTSTSTYFPWPTSVTVSLFQDGGANTIGASLYQNTFSSFASDVLSGNGTDIVTVKLGTMLLAAGSYDLFIYSPGSFTFDGLPGGPGNQIIQFVAAGVGPSVGDGYYFIGANTDSGISIGLSVPETSSWVMMLAGFAGLGFLGYRRNKATALSA
jgi:hypothetical protein